MGDHRHTFVDTYDGMVGFGFSRETDEKTVMFYLQKFSDDDMLKALIPRLSDEELEHLFEYLNSLMRRHLVDDEYHSFFLKDEGHHHHDD
jgi:TorA maturation chaperone TorD